MVNTKVAIIVAVGVLALLGAFVALRHHNKGKALQAGRKISPTAVYDAYTHYKQKHGLKFGAAEDDMRLSVFTQNYQIIADHHEKNSTYTLGFTSLAHYTREEFAALKLGYKGQKVGATQGVKLAASSEETVDWTTKGAVTHVKNQGQCGSCWAFSAIGSLEGLHFIKDGKLESMSEQELVDCAGSYGNQGCNGGLMDQGFQYVADNGVAAEADYPYTAADGDCQTKKKVFKNKGFTDVAANDDGALVAAIAQQPVSVAIEADTSDFQLYTGGVITGDACGTQLDHGVLAVGYGKDHIKVKNSWGGSWGVNGYVLIGRATGAGVCGINSAASYPTA